VAVETFLAGRKVEHFDLADCVDHCTEGADPVNAEFDGVWLCRTDEGVADFVFRDDVFNLVLLVVHEFVVFLVGAEVAHIYFEQTAVGVFAEHKGLSRFEAVLDDGLVGQFVALLGLEVVGRFRVGVSEHDAAIFMGCDYLLDGRSDHGDGRVDLEHVHALDFGLLFDHAQHVHLAALVDPDVGVLVDLERLGRLGQHLLLVHLAELVGVLGVAVFLEETLEDQQLEPVLLLEEHPLGVHGVELDFLGDLVQLVLHLGVGQKGLGLDDVEHHLGVQVLA